MFTFCEGSHGDNKIIQAMATEANIKPSEKSYLLERLHRSVNIMSLLALLSRKLVLHLPCPLLLLPFNGHASPIMAAKLVHGFSDTQTHTHTHCSIDLLKSYGVYLHLHFSSGYGLHSA